MEELWERPAEGPRFGVVWRGYDRHQVDEYIQSLSTTNRSAAEERPVDDIDVRLTEISKGPGMLFDVVLRGYDRREAERFDR